MKIPASNIVKFIEAGVNEGPYSGWDGGFISGGPDDTVGSVAVTWMTLSPVLEAIAAENFDMIICHERPWIGPGESYAGPWGDDNVPKTPAADLQRKNIIENNGITLFMCHYGLDKLIIFDEMAQALELEEPVTGKGYNRVYTMKTLTVEELALKIKRIFKLDFVRFAGNKDKKVKRAGLLFGGTGLNINSKVRIPFMVENGADVLIAGEMDEFTIYNAYECGLPVMECGHAVSETPGLRKFSGMLQKRFPDIRVEFFSGPDLINII